MQDQVQVVIVVPLTVPVAHSAEFYERSTSASLVVPVVVPPLDWGEFCH